MSASDRAPATRTAVVIVNYNAGGLLRDCIVSTLNQADEIVVVDNASRDDSLARTEATWPDEPRLSIIRNAENRGFAVACNQGVAATLAPAILFLNPDCRLPPNAVADLLSVLEKNPDAGAVGALLENHDGSEQEGARRAKPTPWRSFVRAFGLHRLARLWPHTFFDYHLHKTPLPNGPVEVDAVSGACIMVWRDRLAEVGGWDEGYFLHCEDLDLCQSLYEAGHTILFTPTVRVRHALGASSRPRPIFVEWHKHRGMMRYYRKHFRRDYPGALMWLVATGVWLRFVIVAGTLSIKRLTGTIKETMGKETA